MTTRTVDVPDEVEDRRADDMGVRDETVPGMAFPNRADELCRELAAIAAECRSADWDGQGADAVSPETLLQAQRFIDGLPGDLLGASAGAEADGHLTLEWYRDPTWILSVSFGPDSNLYYAASFGTSNARGREMFEKDVPEMILNLIRRASRS